MSLFQIDHTHEYWYVIKFTFKVELQVKKERKQALKRFEWVQEHGDNQRQKDQESRTICSKIR